MIFRIYLSLAALFVVLFLYLSSLNNTSLSIRLSSANQYELPVIPLLFAAFIAGFFIHLIVTTVRGGQRYLHSLKTARENKNLKEAERLVAGGKKAIFLGNTEKGIELLQKAISMNRDLLEPYLMLSEYHLDNEDYDKASAILHDLPAELENDITVQMERSHLYSVEGNYKGAAAILKRLNEKEGGLDLKRLLRDTYIEAEAWEEASSIQKEIVKALKKDDASSEDLVSAQIKHERAKRLLEEKKGDEAVKKFSELNKKYKSYAPPYVNLGKHYFVEGNREMAVATWKKGYAATKNLIFIFLMEDFYLKEEAPQEIIEIYKGLIREEAGNPLLHLFLGKLYLRLEMKDDAIERFEKAYELGLESPYLSRLQGEVAYRSGNFEEAASRFKEAMGQKRQILIPFICTSCGDESNDWHGTCPECGEWDRLQIAVATKEETA
ncbi:MAG: hypothetical protein IMF07_07555 [Proteobacteria bacterium]|nr:hypothetical protein [Pseudomonadota bacterium]